MWLTGGRGRTAGQQEAQLHGAGQGGAGVGPRQPRAKGGQHRQAVRGRLREDRVPSAECCRAGVGGRVFGRQGERGERREWMAVGGGDADGEADAGGVDGDDGVRGGGIRVEQLQDGARGDGLGDGVRGGEVDPLGAHGDAQRPGRIDRADHQGTGALRQWPLDRRLTGLARPLARGWSVEPGFGGDWVNLRNGGGTDRLLLAERDALARRPDWGRPALPHRPPGRARCHRRASGRRRRGA